MGAGQEGSAVYPTPHRWHAACWGERDIIKGNDRRRAEKLLLGRGVCRVKNVCIPSGALLLTLHLLSNTGLSAKAPKPRQIICFITETSSLSSPQYKSCTAASSHFLHLGVGKRRARLALWFDQHNKQDCRSKMAAERSRELEGNQMKKLVTPLKTSGIYLNCAALGVWGRLLTAEAQLGWMFDEQHRGEQFNVALLKVSPQLRDSSVSVHHP